MKKKRRKKKKKRIEKELEKNKLLLEECFALLQPSPVGQKKVVFHVYHRVGIQIIRMVWAEDLKNLTEIVKVQVIPVAAPYVNPDSQFIFRCRSLENNLNLRARTLGGHSLVCRPA